MSDGTFYGFPPPPMTKENIDQLGMLCETSRRQEALRIILFGIPVMVDEFMPENSWAIVVSKNMYAEIMRIKAERAKQSEAKP
jgi:hypothetical protein